MIFRKAESNEAEKISPFLMLAMKDIVYRFIGEESEVKAQQFLTDLIAQKANQYSHENCWIVELNDEIAAVAVVYDGAMLHELRMPVASYIKAQFDRDFTPEDETQSGEYYIDCISVIPRHQGKGIGSQLLQFLIDEYVNKCRITLGLLVDKDNPSARKLYFKMGFEVAGTKILTGKTMDHLQIKYKAN